MGCGETTHSCVILWHGMVCMLDKIVWEGGSFEMLYVIVCHWCGMDGVCGRSV